MYKSRGLRRPRHLLLVPVCWYVLVCLSSYNDLFLLDDGSSSSSSSSSHQQAFADGSSKEECPAAVQKATGVYQDEDSHEGASPRPFERVVLLTAANYGYLEMLQNWQGLAREQGLKWAVLAMDRHIYEKLGPSRAVSTDTEFAVEAAVNFRTQGFNKLSCNKLRSVLRIIEACDVDVVFSDCDNIFLGDPFEHDLGRMIASGNSDYIYQVNDGTRSTSDRQHSCLTRGERVMEGNTGFYYMSRSSTILKQTIRSTLEKCARPDNKLDDQTLFWKELRKRTTRHCTATESDSPGASAPKISNSTEETPPLPPNLCCLDPYYYPIGRSPSEHMITYHANYANRKFSKVKKLKMARRDGHGFKLKRIESCRFPWMLVRTKCWSLMLSLMWAMLAASLRFNI